MNEIFRNILRSIAFLPDSDGVLVYLQVYGLEKENLIFQLSCNHFPFPFANFTAKVRDNAEILIIILLTSIVIVIIFIIV